MTVMTTYRHRALQVAVWMGVLCCISIWSWGQTEAASTAWKKQSKLILDGKRVTVYWPDGDTFRLLRGPNQRRSPAARLVGYNTLENYGPVHKWGTWTAQELFHVGNQASKVARSKAWHCFTKPGSGGYGRILASCPKLAETLIAKGLAHVFSMGASGDPKLLKIQKIAIQRKRGIWAKGVPPYIVTSIHSASAYRRRAYNRVLSTSTGGSLMYRHGDSYNTCGWVCLRGSCMLYVPHRQRYGANKASCLIVKSPKAKPKARPAARVKAKSAKSSKAHPAARVKAKSVKSSKARPAPRLRTKPTSRPTTKP